MSEEQWKLEQDLCRCCLNEGSFKNLAEPCLNQGEEEIYSEMLLESLDINITPVSGPLCTSTYTICEECVLRLRDACSFKRQVLLSEKRFRELYRRDVIKLHSSSLDVKQEVPDSDNEDGDPVKMEMDQNEDDDDFRISYEHDDADSKSNIEIEIQEEKKAKPRKPKAKEKPKPKKKAGRPRKVKAEADAEADDDTKDKKGNSRLEHTFADSVEQKNTRCNDCDKTFISKKGLIIHMSKRHAENDTKHACKICNKVFLNRYGLFKHTWHIHQCLECSVVFADKTELWIHREKEHGVVIPTCGVCGFKNVRKCLVDSHQRMVHMKEKNVSCPKCNEMFYGTNQLTKHMVRHNPVKSYECEFCRKKFARKTTMQTHLKIHMGIKNKVCPVCEQRFVQRASLTYHMSKHHPGAAIPSTLI